MTPLRLHPFPLTRPRGLRLGHDDAEWSMWCGRRPHPCRPSRSAPRPRRMGGTDLGPYRGEWLVATELWADDGEAEVELARLIVAPGKRGQGVSRGLVANAGRRSPVQVPAGLPAQSSGATSPHSAATRGPAPSLLARPGGARRRPSRSGTSGSALPPNVADRLSLHTRA